MRKERRGRRKAGGGTEMGWSRIVRGRAEVGRGGVGGERRR